MASHDPNLSFPTSADASYINIHKILFVWIVEIHVAILLHIFFQLATMSLNIFWIMIIKSQVCVVFLIFNNKFGESFQAVGQTGLI